MKDIPLSIALTVAFGISGLAMLILALLQPMAGSERGMAFFIGAVGILVALIRALVFKTWHTRTETRQVSVKIESGNEF
ncbi:hypothetical protein ACFLUB_03595 [Chloroflexota bacterium]